MNINYQIKIYTFYKIYINRFLKNNLKYFNKVKYFKLIKLPKNEKKFTVLRSPHINKKSKEQFSLKIYKLKIIIKLTRLYLTKLINVFKLLNIGRNKKFLPLKLNILQESII